MLTALFVIFANMMLSLLLSSFIFPAAPPVPKAADPVDTVSVAVIGDVMMHRRQLEFDHSVFLSGLTPLLSSADIAIANAEFSLGGSPYTGYPSFSAPDSYLQSILASGVDVLLTANNHVLDRGSDGLERTLRQYPSFAGAGLDEAQYLHNNPLILRKGGLRLALVNFTYGTNMAQGREYPKVSRMSRPEVERQMKVARENADVVVALPHWGDEYVLRHNRKQEEWAKWLVEQGADVIIGSHPHVVQDTAHIKGVPVVYSLGNAVSNMSARNTRLELAVTFRVLYHRISGKTVLEEPELHFMWCTLPGRKSDNYGTVFVEEMEGCRDAWLIPSDYDEMMATYARVKKETGIK